MRYNRCMGGESVRDLTYLHWSYSSSSSGGTYLKSEYATGGRKYYYKLSDFRYGRFTGCETAIEVIVSRLGAYLRFPTLKYTGEMARISVDGKEYETFVARSLNFVKSGYTAIPLVTDYLTNRLSKTESHIDYCRRIGLQEYLDYVFMLDYLIMNVDRHGHNIEILYDRENNLIPSPIFDNGRALTFEHGSNIQFIRNWDYKTDITVNNFVGSLSLEKNLQNVSRPYKLPQITDEAYKKIFYGLGQVISKEHKEILIEALSWRYEKMRNGGIIL